MKRRRAALAAWLVAAVLASAAAGCGGGGDATVTRTTPSPGERLQAYFDQMAAKERRFEQLGNAVVGAVAGLHLAAPDATWRRAAKRLAAASRGFDRLGLAISRVHPPPALAEAHARFAAAVVGFSQYAFGLQQALRIGVPGIVSSAAASDTRAISSARAEWVAALAHAAGVAGIPRPEWLLPQPAA